jgi:hypothetical protein
MIHGSGEASEEEVVLEEVSEVPREWRRPSKGLAGVEASCPSAGIEASAQCPAVKQRAIMAV